MAMTKSTATFRVTFGHDIPTGAPRPISQCLSRRLHMNIRDLDGMFELIISKS